MKRLGLILSCLLLATPAWAFTRELPGDNVTTFTFTERSGATNDNTIWTPTSGRSIVLMGFCAGSLTGGAELRLEDGSTGADIVGPIFTGATAAAIQSVCGGTGSTPIWEGGTNVSMSWSTTAAASSFTVWGYEQ